MRFFVITILFCLLPFFLFSQELEFTTSFGQNTFYKLKVPPNFESYSYASGNAIAANIRLKLISENFPTGEFLVFCSIEHYIGGFDHSINATGSGDRTIGTTDKTTLSIGLYPLNYKILKRLDIHIGIQMSFLLNEKNRGSYSVWTLNNLSGSNFSLEGEELNIRTIPALNIKLSYPIKINDTISILPEYMGILGLVSELQQIGYPRSMRNYLGVGLTVKL